MYKYPFKLLNYVTYKLHTLSENSKISEVKEFDEFRDFLEWDALSDEEKHRIRRAALSFGKKNADDLSQVLFKYGDYLIIVYERIIQLIDQIMRLGLDLDKFRGEFALYRFLLMLEIEKYYLNTDVKPKNHIHPDTFVEVICNIQDKGISTDLRVNEFIEDYKKMYALWMETGKVVSRRFEKDRST